MGPLERCAEIDHFQQGGDKPDAPQLFLLSTHTCGLGINLTMVGTIVFYNQDWVHTIQLALHISSCSARNATSSGCGASGTRTTWTQTLGQSKRKPKLQSTTSSHRPLVIHPKAPSLCSPSSVARTSHSPPTCPCTPLTPAPTTRQEISASSSSRHGQRRLYEPDPHLVSPTPTPRQAYSHLPTCSGHPLGLSFTFRLRSEVTYKDKVNYHSVAITGDVFVCGHLGCLVRVAYVDFECNESHGNPVMAYLQCHGSAKSAPIPVVAEYHLTSSTNPSLYRTLNQ